MASSPRAIARPRERDSFAPAPGSPPKPFAFRDDDGRWVAGRAAREGVGTDDAPPPLSLSPDVEDDDWSDVPPSRSPSIASDDTYGELPAWTDVPCSREQSPDDVRQAKIARLMTVDDPAIGTLLLDRCAARARGVAEQCRLDALSSTRHCPTLRQLLDEEAASASRPAPKAPQAAFELLTPACSQVVAPQSAPRMRFDKVAQARVRWR